MIKKDYGRIFIPQDYGINYSKSPQAIVYRDFVRFYFSYCVPDNGKLKSRIGYVDYTKDFTNIVRYSLEVISDGKLGTFDEHGIFPFSPFRVDDRICALTSGWSRRMAVSVETGIGLAVSTDGGETFDRYGDGPVLTSSLEEPFLVVDGFVVKKENSKYRMFYIFGTDWINYANSKQPERTYKIGYADSNNLLDWERHGRQILEDKFPYESQALPTVLNRNGIWHMFFCYRHSVNFRDNSENSYRIGYASSKDGDNWIRKDEQIKIPEADWCSEMQCYPCVFECDGQIYLAYNGNRFGYNGFGLLEIDI